MGEVFPFTQGVQDSLKSFLQHVWKYWGHAREYEENVMFEHHCLVSWIHFGLCGHRC
jgi:hypothetical protein